MSTIRQKRLAENIVKNIKAKKQLNKKELLVSSGYDELTATQNAKPTIESKGVQKELKILGFDSESAKKVVSEILRFGEDDHVKLKAADMIFKVQGEYAPEKHLVADLKVELSASVAKKYDVSRETGYEVERKQA